MAKVVAFANHKGGVSKTTVSTSVADALSRDGYEVLVVDVDPQANATKLLYSFDDAPSGTIEQVLEGKISVAQSITTDTHVHGVDLIGATLMLGGVQKRMQTTPFASTAALKKVLDTVSDAYDVIIVDTPPALDFMTANALYAADMVFVPVESGSKLSLLGTDDMLKFISDAQGVNPRLQFGAAILTKHDARKKLCKITSEAVKGYYGRVLAASLPVAEDIRKAQALGQTVIQYDRNLNASSQVISMAREIAELAGFEKRVREQNNAPEEA
ncbi:ParA family protein [Burkholderia anthina]|uniref:ParA family protein n=1 Tax=Burkholderia anthina TaxID=179879 RepID=UPI001588A0A9|nr:ParA family protein [Burkholderia anthina]